MLTFNHQVNFDLFSLPSSAHEPCGNYWPTEAVVLLGSCSAGNPKLGCARVPPGLHLVVLRGQCGTGNDGTCWVHGKYDP